MSAAPTLCWLALQQGKSAGREMLPQLQGQEPQSRCSSRVSTTFVLLAGAPLTLLAAASKTMRPSDFGWCLALSVAGRFANRRRFGNAASGPFPALYR